MRGSEQTESPGRSDDRRLVQLYDSYGAFVYARCRHMLGENAAAEDITQETFLRVHRRLDAIPAPDGVLPWLYRIATNLCLNALRDRRGRPLLVERLPERPDASGDEQLANRDLVARLIARVPQRVQTTAWLFYMDGMHQNEIADLLGVSRRTVTKRLGQFTRKSRQFLRTEGRGP